MIAADEKARSADAQAQREPLDSQPAIGAGPLFFNPVTLLNPDLPTPASDSVACFVGGPLDSGVWGLRPIRVLHVYKTFFPDSVGGLEHAIAQTVESTRACGVDNRIVSVSCKPFPARAIRRGADHFRYNETLSVASNSMSLALWRKFGEHVAWADVVHYHFPWPFADLLHLSWRVRKPSVVTYHSDIVRQRKLMLCYQPLMRAFLNRVDRIIATSPNYVETSDVLRHYRDKTRVIPIGLDPGGFPPVKPEVREHWKGRVGSGFFLFIGVIRYYKGLHILLDAAQGTDLPVVIVGAGPIEAELRMRAASMGLRNVQFLGALPEDDKVALLELSSAVVFPSHMRSEAFGVTLLEGAAFGKPLISSEIGTGTSYVNVDGETGLVIRADDPRALREAMLKLAGDAALRERLGAGGRKRFEEKFTAARMGRRYVEAYEDVLGLGQVRLADPDAPATDSRCKPVRDGVPASLAAFNDPSPLP